MELAVNGERAASVALLSVAVHPTSARLLLVVVGSASLPWSHQRPPATALIGGRLGTGQQEPQHQDIGVAAAVMAKEGAVPAMAIGSVEGGCADAANDAFQLPDSIPAGDADHEGAGVGKAGSSRRPPLMHPGYFTATSGPSYTPAPPEALIDASALTVLLGSFMDRD